MGSAVLLALDSTGFVVLKIRGCFQLLPRALAIFWFKLLTSFSASSLLPPIVAARIAAKDGSSLSVGYIPLKVSNVPNSSASEEGVMVNLVDTVNSKSPWRLTSQRISVT